MAYRVERFLTCAPEDVNTLAAELIGHLWFDAGFFWRCTSVVIGAGVLRATYE